MTPLAIILLVVGVLGGTGAGYTLRKTQAKKSSDNAEAKAEALLNEAKTKTERLLQEAETKGQNLVHEARESSNKILQEAKREENNRRNDMKQAERRVEKRESMFDQKIIELEDKKEKLEEQKEKLEELKQRVRDIKEQQVQKLQQVGELTKEEAKERLLTAVERDCEDALLSRINKMQQKTEDELEREARKVLSLALVRYASSQSVDSTTTYVQLPSDEMKGRIIGKEGRNIKSLETLTGTEIIVDDTPERITISGFSPIRRQIAKRAIEALIKDGRIHPARIEETVISAKKDLAKDIMKAGEDALYQLGIPVPSIDPKLISILGRMKYRTSYGQNALQHSIEVAQLSAVMAEELGADVFICKKGGLFHDIGKAVDHDMAGAHPEIGYNIMKKFGFPEEIAYQSIAHHEDRPKTIEGTIVKAADALSGARPGARKQSLEQFLTRMKDLERTAAAQEGVEKAYAIQAGREVRVFVKPEKIDDLTAFKLAKNIANKIEAELTYPGEVKVTVIRETRVTEYAR